MKETTATIWYAEVCAALRDMDPDTPEYRALSIERLEAATAAFGERPMRRDRPGIEAPDQPAPIRRIRRIRNRNINGRNLGGFTTFGYE